MTSPWTLCTALVLTTLSIVPARAQTASSPATGPGRLELGIGVAWIGNASFGSRDANETTGTGGTLRLFASSTELASGSGLDAHVAFSLTRRLEAEAYLSYTQPELQTRIDSDTETSNAPLTISDTIRQFAIGGAALWYLQAPRAGGRLRLFVRGGIGGLRQLENDGTLIVTGREYEAGGGVKILFSSRSSGFWKGLGARAEARAVIRQKGVAFDDNARVAPAVAASIFVRF
jgi:hypothetical protein